MDDKYLTASWILFAVLIFQIIGIAQANWSHGDEGAVVFHLLLVALTTIGGLATAYVADRRKRTAGSVLLIGFYLLILGIFALLAFIAVLSMPP